jgi:hypothetical protein
VEQQSYSEKIRFQAPKPVKEILDRRVRALRISRGEYLRSLILNDDRTTRQQPQK